MLQLIPQVDSARGVTDRGIWFFVTFGAGCEHDSSLPNLYHVSRGFLIEFRRRVGDLRRQPSSTLVLWSQGNLLL
jgi:hypothetical protein